MTAVRLTTMPTQALEILYVGTLPPHQGGSALMSWQLLEALEARGHRVTAIAPITEADRSARERLRRSSGLTRERRFVMPYLATSPDLPQSKEYREQERGLVASMLAETLAELAPDVLIVGRESFAPHVDDTTGIPRVLIVQGATTAGMVNGSYPGDLAAPLLASMRSYDRVVTSAPPTQRTLADLGIPGVAVIPNPVDLTRFRPGVSSRALRTTLDIGDDDVVVTHPSNLKKLKRPLDIVLAAEIALARNRHLLFVIAGDGPCRDAVARECETRGVASRFRLTGWLDHARMPELLCSSEMVVMPSETECQALVYLETQACGRVLIASDIPAAREVVDDGVSGLLFPCGDTRSLAIAILRCAGDRELRRALGAGGRANAFNHSLADVALAYEELLRSVATGQRQAGPTPSST